MRYWLLSLIVRLFTALYGDVQPHPDDEWGSEQ